MNLEVLSPTKRKPQPGDVFVAKMKSQNYFIPGKVVSNSAKIRSMEGSILVYIYSVNIIDKSHITMLDKNKLLIPPFVINQQPWFKGYFEFVGNQQLTQDDILPQHCFVDFIGRYYDEQNHQLPERTEPCGEYGLQSYRTVDDSLSQAMDIPLSDD